MTKKDKSLDETSLENLDPSLAPKEDEEKDLQELITEQEKKIEALHKINISVSQDVSKLTIEKEELRKTVSSLSKSAALLQEKLKEKDSTIMRDIEAALSQNYRKVGKEMLEVLDNIERMKEIVESNKTDFIKVKNKEIISIVIGLENGLGMIESQMKKVLKTYLEVEEISVNEGDCIDVENHMEIEIVSNKDIGDKTVYKIVRKGYKYKNQLLRPVLIIANRY